MIAKRISDTLGLNSSPIINVLKLNSEGATIPFIARYRKEMTGSLDEVEISAIIDKYNYYTKLEERKVFILETIKEQGKLTPMLKAIIIKCFDAVALEDIYLPYKKKRKTRGSIAKEHGLEPLATLIYKQSYIKLDLEVEKFISKNLKTKQEVLDGAKDIIAEWINEDQNIRQKVRGAFKRYATIKTKVVRGKNEEAIKYKDYFDFEEKLSKCPAHRLLAMRRGEKENLLRLVIQPDAEQTIFQLENFVLKNKSNTAKIVQEALEDSYKRLLQPSIENEFRKASKETADITSISVFAKNLEQLILAPPITSQSVLAIDPGFRTGCKIACLNSKGTFLESATIFPHPPKQNKEQSAKTIKYLVEKHNITAFAIGNGTAGQETFDFIETLKLVNVESYMVNESGASIYSASPIAREEFPDLDLTVRGAISIGRRLMDPMAELVKIDPKSIGVGQYQHDVNQTLLKESLDRIIEKSVNSVGVNLDTASAYLLEHVSGISSTVSKNIIDFRNEHKEISSIASLKKVKGLGPKAFEQCAGFLRLKKSKELLDNTGVHPESYSITKSMIKELKKPMSEVLSNTAIIDNIDIKKYVTDKIGIPTLKDIIKELKKPGLDPRGTAKLFSFDRSISSIENLHEGYKLPGIVTNLTNFGAFVDIGIKANGLLHISQISNTFIKDPSEVLSVGQQLEVTVIGIEVERNRIQLTIKQ